MNESNDNKSNEARAARAARWIRNTALVFVGACSGIVLYKALYPGFYYLHWIGYLPILWVLVGLACLGQVLALLAVGHLSRASWSRPPHSGLGFMLGLLVLVTVLIGFKVPLHASFLLAKPDLEDAVASYSDDLEQVGRLARYYYCGIYPIQGAQRRCHVDDRIHFRFRDDGESAIVYSESGIEDLCYNSGAKGHLSGNWYWMKED